MVRIAADLGHIPDPVAVPGIHAYRYPLKPDGTAVRDYHPENTLYESGLARSVWADNGHSLSTGAFKADTVQYLLLSKGFIDLI